MKPQYILLLGIVGLTPILWSCSPPQSDTIVVYSSRNEDLIAPIFTLYKERTGVTVNYVTDDAGPLVEKLKAEGRNTRADILLTVDAGNLWHAAENGLLRSVESETLAANIPAHLRDPKNQWFGLSLRARTLVYSPRRVSPNELVGYADLAESKWKGRLCLRTSRKVYNQSLVAMLIAQYGEARTEEIVRGWVANLASDVFSNDTTLMQAIIAGQCDVGIVNSYYFGRLQEQSPDLPLALFWADQGSTGVHVNISGAGVTRYAPHAQLAVEFLEWLSSDESQRMFAERNHEYAANPQIEPDALVKSWGSFESSNLPLVKAGELQAEAVKLMDRAGYR